MSNEERKPAAAAAPSGESAPLLTRELAKEARRMLGSMSMHADAAKAWLVYEAIEAIAEERAITVPASGASAKDQRTVVGKPRNYAQRIAAYRTEYGCSLKEARDAVDAADARLHGESK